MDRKTVARAYKDSRRPMGVYCVRNLRSGATLIGRSIDITATLNREESSLRFGGHANRQLQQDWMTLGPAAFSFEVLDTLAWPEDSPAFDPTADLKALESMWRERLQPDGAGNYAARMPAVRS